MYSRMDQVKFVEDSLYKSWSDMVCLSKSYLFIFLKAVFHKIYLANSWVHRLILRFWDQKKSVKKRWRNDVNKKEVNKIAKKLLSQSTIYLRHRSHVNIIAKAVPLSKKHLMIGIYS